jgi:hypothetical protein
MSDNSLSAGQASQADNNGMATGGMVVGIIAAALSLIPVVGLMALPLALVGAPLSGVGFVRSRTTGLGRGAAITGIATNVVALTLWAAWAFVWGAAMSASA